jgi:hypothetical protein
MKDKKSFWRHTMCKLIRLFLVLTLLVSLAACSDNNTPEPTPVPEATEQANYAFELDGTYSFDLGWGGQAVFNYPSDWQIRVQRGINVHAPDNYVITVSADNNPNANNDAQSQLDRLNQNNEILTADIDGVTVFYSFVPMSSRLLATVQLDEQTYGLMQLVNTRSQDLEPMLDTLLQMTASMQAVGG